MAYLPPPSFEIPRPPLEPPLHGLVETAYPIDVTGSDEHWMAGVVWSPNPQSCGHVIPWQSFTDDPADKADPDANVPSASAYSFVLTYSTHCHVEPASLEEQVEIAKQALEVGTSQAIEAIFWGPGDTGPLADIFGDGGNFSLSGSTPNITGGACQGIINAGGTSEEITAYTPKQALLALTQAIGNCALGARGYIHAPVYLVEDWAEQGLITLTDPTDPTSQFITNVRGDRVVGGSGYSGTGPDGHPLEIPADGYSWAYASGPVGLLMSEPREQETTYVDHATNLHKIIVERTVVIAAQDTCLFAAYVDVA